MLDHDGYSDPRITHLDFDSPAEALRLGRLMAVARILGIRPHAACWTRTRRGWHVSIRWDRAFDRLALVSLQAILGSDLKRECLNLMRALADPAPAEWAARRWNILYSRKVANGRKRV